MCLCGSSFRNLFYNCQMLIPVYRKNSRIIIFQCEKGFLMVVSCIIKFSPAEFILKC